MKTIIVGLGRLAKALLPFAIELKAEGRLTAQVRRRHDQPKPQQGTGTSPGSAA